MSGAGWHYTTVGGSHSPVFPAVWELTGWAAAHFSNTTPILFTALFIGWWTKHCYSILHRLIDRTHRSDTTHTLLQHTSQADGQNTQIRYNTHTVTAHFTGWWTEHTDDQTQHTQLQHTSHVGRQNTLIKHNTHTLTAHFTDWETEHIDQIQHPHCYCCRKENTYHSEPPHSYSAHHQE